MDWKKRRAPCIVSKSHEYSICVYLKSRLVFLNSIVCFPSQVNFQIAIIMETSSHNIGPNLTAKNEHSLLRTTGWYFLSCPKEFPTNREKESKTKTLYVLVFLIGWSFCVFWDCLSKEDKYQTCALELFLPPLHSHRLLLFFILVFNRILRLQDSVFYLPRLLVSLPPALFEFFG